MTPSPAPSVAASGDFAFSVNGEPTYFSLAYTDLPTSWIVGLIYTGMFRANNKLAIVPDMATALPVISADGLTWTVTLKDGIKWQDGSPFTADDVVFTYQLAYSANCTYIPDFCSSIGDNLADSSGAEVKPENRKAPNAGVKALDAKTVEFKLKQKFAPFLVTGLSSIIMPKAAVEASYAKFAAAAGTVNAADVKTLKDKIDAALADKACTPTAPAGATPPPPPDSCDIASDVADMEAILNSAQITLPDKAVYPKLDDNGAPIPGEVDNSAYGTALKVQLDDLNNTLAAGETDKIAASFRLLDFQRAPIGTGPYKFGKYSTGQSVTLDANPDYYHPFGGPVGPAHVNIPVIKDAATEAQALQNGDIKWLTEVNSDALAALQADPNLKLSSYADFGYYFIAFNLRDGHPYADKVAREAFSMCIDHDATVAAATDNQGQAVQANTPPASWAYNKDVTPYKLDVAGAKAKLEAAGYALGSDNVYAKGDQKLSTKLYVRQGRPQRVKFAQLAKDQLALCGISIDIAESDFATVLLPLLSYPNKFDTYLGGWSTSIDPDDFSIFHSSHATTKTNINDNNFPGWNNPAADKLLVDGRQELDQAKRKDIYFQFQQIIHDDLPYYFLWADQAHKGYSAKVSSTGDPIDYTSPLDYWNNDAWIVAQ